MENTKILDKLKELEELILTETGHAANINIELKNGLTLMDVANAVCKRLYVNIEEVGKACRHRNIVDARKIISYMAKLYVKDVTLMAIAKLFNQHDHTSVLNYINKMSSLEKRHDPLLYQKTSDCFEILTHLENDKNSIHKEK